MPCFLITIAGPTFAVYGAIFSDIAVVDPLTTTFHLYWLKNNNEMMTALSSTFRALKLSLKELDKYYENMIQIFPRQHLSFPDVKEDNNTIIERKAYVKAVQKKDYSLTVHKFLADSGHAPIIIYNTEIPGGWLLIYMECLDQHLMLDRITRNLNDGERLEKQCGFDIKFIDFEWSGVVGTARYPNFMNHINIKWPDGRKSQWTMIYTC
ncbi:hypothetical protein RclHR1_04980021 [Rhizophagus clarus]|uniref:Uncharacterized protein n=1 Tax=Rhizophagus clarus TaxID=94130 RepID=A0A2Z6RK22_9GLOM|nr:hypothetical protein RclHR1_04980021 [Rhizophagus clarus]